jgi:hypothetical protein
LLSSISMRTGLIQSIGLSTAYTISRHMQAIKQQSIPALFDCVSAYSFNQTRGMGQERSTSW